MFSLKTHQLIKNFHIHTDLIHDKYKVFDLMPEGAQIINYIWQYIYVNDSVASYGQTFKGKLVGRTMMDVYPCIEQTVLFELLEK